MSIFELEGRISEIQQELSIVKESTSNILDITWIISCISVVLFIFIILVLILRGTEGLTVKNTICIFVENLRPLRMKEKIAALSRKSRAVFYVVTTACVLILAVTVIAAILISNYTKPRWVTDTFTAYEKFSDESLVYTGAYALKVEKKLGKEEAFSVDISGVVILQDKEYDVNSTYFDCGRYFLYLKDREDESRFPDEKICIDMTIEFDDIQIEFLD